MQQDALPPVWLLVWPGVRPWGQAIHPSRPEENLAGVEVQATQSFLALFFLAQLPSKSAMAILSLRVSSELCHPSWLYNHIHNDNTNSDFLGSRLYSNALVCSDPLNALDSPRGGCKSLFYR